MTKVPYDMQTLLADMRATIREEVVFLTADLLSSVRLVIKEELQQFNKITEQEMMDKLDALMAIGGVDK